MTISQSIDQLNQERKRRENAVWQEWFVTERNNRITSEALQKRATKFTEIRDWYDKALLQINTQSSTQNTQEQGVNSSDQQTQNTTKSGGAQNTQSQKSAPNDDIVGAANLPQNKPINLGQTKPKRDIDGIQENDRNQNTPTRDRSAQIREAQQEQGLMEQDQFGQNEGSASNNQYLQEALSEIERALAAHDIDHNEFIKALPGYSEYEKLQSIIAESKDVQYTFPVFLLAVAALVDIIEWINLAPGAGLITLVILSILKYTILVPILFVNTFGGASFVSKFLIRKLLMRAFIKKGYFYILSPLVEFIPVLGAFWPGTLLFYLWLTNAKTTAGLILVELAKIVEKVPDDRFEQR